MKPPTHSPTAIIETLAAHRVDFIVVGGVCAVLHGVPMATFDVDVVHSREAENVQRMLAALNDLNARFRERPDLTPVASHLAGAGHLLLVTDCGPLDLLGTIGKCRGYQELAGSSEEMAIGSTRFKLLSLAKLIETKEEAGREKDRLVLPVLRATLEEKRKKQPQSGVLEEPSRD